MWKIIYIAFAFLAMNTYSQEIPTHPKKMYTSPDGKLYIHLDLPIYIWLSTSPDNTSEKHKLISEQSAKYSNPLYFDVEGFNSIRSPWAVDPTSRKTIQPPQDIVFEVYADGTAPTTMIEYGNTVVHTNQGKINIGGGAAITLIAKDALSGIEAIYYSIDNATYSIYKEAIKLEAEKEYVLRYYSVDNVGNVEKPHELAIVYDKSIPVSKLEVEGDKFENILSSRSKILMLTEDAGVGTKHIYYSIDQGPVKTYSSPLLIANISQGEHTLTYYATDLVGNKEAEKKFDFYVDKTPPTIIEEIVGSSFFSGDREFSSGKTKLKLTSFDNKAGVKEVRYSINGGEFQLYDKPVLLTQSSGVLDIKSYAVDNVNNRSNSQAANEKTKIPYIDLSGPQLSHSYNGPKFITRDTVFISSKTKIALKGNDAEAGMHHIEYSVNGSGPKEYTQTFSIETEGYSVVDFTGFDNVDNSSLSSFGCKIDNTGSEISIMFGTASTGTNEGLMIYPTHTVLFVSATDAIVGFQKMTYALNDTPAKEYTGVLKNFIKGKNKVVISAYDQLGNSTQKEILFFIE